MSNFYIACTRFTTETWEQNILYREKYAIPVIYGSSVKIRDTYEKGILMFVAEMNNQTNKILGIGLIRNTLVTDDKTKIYDNFEYNRYIYKGNYWLSREQLITLDPEIVEMLDIILFKGKSNLKRFLGITILTKKLFINWNYELDVLSNKINTVFQRQFNNNNIDEIQLTKTTKTTITTELNEQKIIKTKNTKPNKIKNIELVIDEE